MRDHLTEAPPGGIDHHGVCAGVKHPTGRKKKVARTARGEGRGVGEMGARVKGARDRRRRSPLAPP